MLTLNGDALTNDFYRVRYPVDVRRSWHCPPVQQPDFNTVDLTGGVPEDEPLHMVDDSSRYVVGKLTKQQRKKLEEE